MAKNIGIIVDGPGDKAAIDARFKKKFRVLKTDGPRGHCAPVNKIIPNSYKQMAILKALGCKKVILLLDFECRTQNYKSFIIDLKNELKKHAFGIDIKIVVPNQMIENWFLSDIVELSAKKKYIRNGLSQKIFEGSHGKKEIKKLLIKKHKYNEIKNGAELFPLVRQSVGIKNSPSLNDFFNSIS